jgi:hypothetical protein
MTAGSGPIDRGRERAQIVLVGAVAIAFIIVGLVLVANTVLYTESVGAERSLGAGDDATAFQGVARDDTASLVYRVNERNNFSTRAALDTAVRNEVQNLSDLLATEYGQRSGAFVNVSANLSHSEYGARIEQDDGTAFNNTDGNGTDWTPIKSDESTQIAEFEATFDVSEMPEASPTDEPFYVEVTGASETRYVSFYNDNGNLSIVSDSSAPIGGIGGLTPDCTVSTGDRVLVDLSNGSAPGADCTFDGLDSIDGPYSLVFRNGDRAFGSYSFVVEDESIASASKYDDASDGDDPYSAYVYWEILVETKYVSPEVSYDLERIVPIYTGLAQRYPRYTEVIEPRDRTAGATNVTYDVNATVDPNATGSGIVGDSLGGLMIDIEQVSDTDGMFDDVTVDDLEQLGLDKNGDGQIDEPVDLDEVTVNDVRDSGTTIEFDINTGPSVDAGDSVLFTFDNVSNPDGPTGDSYDVEVTINPSSSSEQASGTVNTTAATPAFPSPSILASESVPWLGQDGARSATTGSVSGDERRTVWRNLGVMES